MATRGLGSILLGSRDPDRLRAWYRAVLAPDHTGAGPLIDFGGAALIIDGRDDIEERNPEPGRAVLDFVVDDALAAAARLDDVGVSWLVEVRDRLVGLVGTVVDPDGNHVRIVERTHTGTVRR